MPSPEGKNQVGKRKEQSADRQVVSRCSVGSPKVTDLKDVEDQGRKAKEMTKGRIAEWFGEPDLLRRMALRSIFLMAINTFSNIMFSIKFYSEHSLEYFFSLNSKF